MPSLNQAQFIAESIRSFAEQDYPNKELIVIDGGSTDGTIDVLAKLDVHIEHQVSEKDSGQSEAINKGLKMASGDIVTWLNSDDLYTPGTLRAVADFFDQNHNTGLLHGRSELFGKGKRSREIGMGTVLQPHEYLPYMRFPQPSGFMRHDLLRRTGPLNQALHMAMDFELVARSVLLGESFWASAAVFSRYRLHKDSKTQHEEKFIHEWTEVLLNVFHSIDGAEIYLEKMIELGLAKSDSRLKYPVSRFFSQRELSEVYLEHLHLLFHYHYRNFNSNPCLALYKAIKKENQHVAEKRGYTKYLSRLKYVPKALFKLKRRFES